MIVRIPELTQEWADVWLRRTLNKMSTHAVRLGPGLVRLRYSKVRFNCFESEGSCLLPVMALFNHSCAPNAAITRLGMVEVL